MKFLKNIFTLNKKKNTERTTEEELDKSPEFSLGEFNVNDFPEEYRNEKFYFYQYHGHDGEWIEADTPICKIRFREIAEPIFEGADIIASKSGILEHTIEKNDLLTNGKTLYKLHRKGEYQNENSIENFEYKEYFKQVDFKYSFKWLIDDGAWVEIGDPIFEFENSKNQKHRNFAKKAGFVHQVDPQIILPETNQLIYLIRENDYQRIKERFVNCPNIIVDEFTNSTIIKWHSVSSKYDLSEGIITKSDNLVSDLLFSFNFINDSDYIVFHFKPEQIRPKQFDKVSFLFEDGDQIHFELATNPISSKNRKKENILEYKGLITKSELELFANSVFKKWKISLVNDKTEILGGEAGGDDYYRTKNNIQIAIKKFTNDYIIWVKQKIPNYKPTELYQAEPDKEVTADFCFVYLMHDTSNGYYKIGISNNPEYRERTLQSEKPTIELITLKKLPVRKIAESLEKALHDTYSEKRLRGEWFELNSNDVEHVRETLK